MHVRQKNICSFCHKPVNIKGAVSCPVCTRPYHTECWIANQYHCAVLGCQGHGHGKRQDNSYLPIMAFVVVGLFCIIFGVIGGVYIYPVIGVQPTTMIIKETRWMQSIEVSTSASESYLTATFVFTPTEISLPTPLPAQFIMPTFASEPQPIPASYQCSDKNDIVFQVGALGKVRTADVSLRRDPFVPDGEQANIIRTLLKGEHIRVLDGPICSQGGTWWEVFTESSSVGWIREILPGEGNVIIRVFRP